MAGGPPALVPAKLPAGLAPKAPTGAAKERATLAPPKAAPKAKAPAPKAGGVAKERATLAPLPKPSAKANAVGTIRTQAGLSNPKTPKYGITPLPLGKGPKLPSTVPTNAQVQANEAARASATKSAKQSNPLKSVSELSQEKALAKLQTTSRANNLKTAQNIQQAGFGNPYLAGQILSLPKTMGEGALQTLEAVGHDVVHPVQTVEHPLHSATATLIGNMVTHDPWVNAIEQGSTAPLQQNSLGALMDLSMAGGAAGKVAETGLLGDTARAAMERAPVTLPETNFALKRGNYSNNPFFHVGQRAMDYWRGSGPEQIDAAIKQRANENYFNGTQSMHNAQSALDKSYSKSAKALKKDGTQDLLGHFTVLRPHTPAVARDMMSRLHDQWSQTLMKHGAAGEAGQPDRLFPEEVKNLKENIKSMAKGSELSDTQLQKVIDEANKQQEFQTSQIAGPKAERGLNAESQMERRALAPYGQLYENAVHTSELPGKILSDAGKAHKEVTDDLNEAQANLNKLRSSKLGGRTADVHDDLKPEKKVVDALNRKLLVAKGVKKAAGDADAVAKAMNEIDKLRADKKIAEHDFKAKRLELQSKAADVRNVLKEQQAALAGKQRYLKGWVTPVEHGPTDEALRRSIELDQPIHGESNLGQEYVPFDYKGAAKRAEQAGITPGYLHMGHAEEESLRDVSRNPTGTTGRGTGSTKAYLGQSFKRGDYAGDLAASRASNLKGLQQLNRAQNWDRMLHDVGMRNEDGTLRDWSNDAVGKQKAAEDLKEYEERTGVPMQLVARHPGSVEPGSSQFDTIGALQHAADQPERLAAVPQAYLKRMQDLEDAQRPAPYIGHLNQLWRGGVLPFSGNYIQAVPQEGLFRTGLSGINPLRTIVPSKLGARQFNAMMDGLKRESLNPAHDPATRAFYADQHQWFKNLTGAGTTFGQQERDLQELMDAARHDPNKAKQAAAHLERIVYKPGKWQLGNMHKLESVQSKAVVNDWVKTMKRTQGSIEAVVKAVGEGKDATNLAADAAHHMNNVLGNYIHRGPAELKLIRNYTPFLPWAKNAVKFVYEVLPRDHPITAGLLTNLGLANAKAWQAQHAGLAPYLTENFLGTNYGPSAESVPGLGGQIDLMRNTPFGVEDTNSPLGTLGGLIMPSMLTPIFGSYGLNSFGQPAKTSTYGVNVQPGSTGALGVLGKNALSMVPYYGAVSKAIEAATGHGIAKDAILSHNRALAAIENALGGSLLPKNYGVYSSGGSTSLGSGGLGSGSVGSSGGLGSGSSSSGGL